ncbi:sodium:calcium antiporter [Candidatus Roizmanbacteria bacterium]|nr:sodium:calcium antiporter [Candidatus Roizmanbacteria bacterium]
MLFGNLLLYILAFIAIWVGAGFIVSSVDRFSKRLRLSSFAVSFVILGLLTSTPEFAVGLTAVAEGRPQVFIGNLIGGIPVIFLFVIPILAIFGNGVKLNHDFDRQHLLVSLGVIAIPSVALLDKKVSFFEGIIFVFLYIMLILLVEKKRGFFDRANTEVLNIKAYSYKDLIKILAGIGIVFVASQLIVDKTLYFSSIFNIPAFYISLIALSLGTNLPELSLAIRTVGLGKKSIAFGDYMGSAAANTLLFGIFTLLSGGEVLAVNSFFAVFLFVVGGLTLFYFLSKPEGIISRRSGIILLCLYVLFVLVQFWR